MTRHGRVKGRVRRSVLLQGEGRIHGLLLSLPGPERVLRLGIVLGLGQAKFGHE